jgi:hypothetical protein
MNTELNQPAETIATEPPLWGAVAVMGHQEHIGHVEHVTIAGATMLRITTPATPDDPQPWRGRHQTGTPERVTIVSAAAIFSITPLSKAETLALLLRRRPMQWAAAAALEGPAPNTDYDQWADDEEGEEADDPVGGTVVAQFGPDL